MNNIVGLIVEFSVKNWLQTLNLVHTHVNLFKQSICVSDIIYVMIYVITIILIELSYMYSILNLVYKSDVNSSY